MVSPDRDTSKGEFPSRFEIPRTGITPYEILSNLEMHEPDIHVDLASFNSLARARYPLPPDIDPENQFGDAFVYWGDAFSNLHGTYMEPKSLFEFLHPVRATPNEAEARLLGASPPRLTPWITLATDDRLVQVNIYSGATTWQAKEISLIGDRGDFTMPERVAYQKALYEIFAPIARQSYSTTFQALDLIPGMLIHEIEDCAATGDTLAGVGRILEKLSGELRIGFKGRRIDVAVATGQALTVLAYESGRSGMPTEINVGFVAWGLSRGIGPELEHKNYITHAPHPVLENAFGKRIFVVGDMGDAAKRLGDERFPWERYRRDFYGIVGAEGRPVASSHHLSDAGISLRLAYANGGLLMTALADAARSQDISDSIGPTIIAVGKRLDLREHGFALRLDQFLTPLHDYLQP